MRYYLKNKLKLKVVRIASVFAMSFCLLAGTRLSAQAPEVKPGPEHAVLKEWEGIWDADIAGQGKGMSTNKVGFNGLWLTEEFRGDFGGMAMEGRGSTSYDSAKKKYVNVWIDSMTTSPMISEGTYDKATKTLTLNGMMPGPDGNTMKVTLVTVTKDANTRVFTLKAAGPDGKDMDMFQVTYKRRAK